MTWNATEQQSATTTGADRPDGPMSALTRFGWRAPLIGGVVAVLLGIAVLVWPRQTLVVVGVLFGVYLLISGVAQLVAALSGVAGSTGLRVLGFISGAISIILGLFCFRGTFESILLLSIWIGISWIFRGITEVMATIDAPGMPGRGWAAFVGVITTIAGIVVMIDPVTSIWALALLAGISAIVIGVLQIVHGFQLHRELKHSS